MRTGGANEEFTVCSWPGNRAFRFSHTFLRAVIRSGNAGAGSASVVR